MKIKMRNGKLKYKVVGRQGAEDSPSILFLTDPHTGRKFPLVNPPITLKHAGYKPPK